MLGLACLTLVSAVVVYFLRPETKSKSLTGTGEHAELAEIAELFGKSRRCAPKRCDERVKGPDGYGYQVGPDSNVRGCRYPKCGTCSRRGFEHAPNFTARRRRAPLIVILGHVSACANYACATGKQNTVWTQDGISGKSQPCSKRKQA